MADKIDRKKIRQEERERRKVQKELDQEEMKKKVVPGCIALVVLAGGLAFVGNACYSLFEPVEKTEEELQLEAERVQAGAKEDAKLTEALKNHLSAIDPLGSLFMPAHTQVTHGQATIRVSNSWYELSERKQRDVVHNISASWNTLTGKPEAFWRMYDEGASDVAGHSLFSGDYVED